MYLNKLKNTLRRLVLKVLFYTLLLLGVSYLASIILGHNVYVIMRVLGFGLMFAGAGAKLSGGDMARDFNYNYSMGAKKMRNRSKYERDTLNSGDKFLIFGVVTGSLVFGISILLEKVL